MMAKTLKNEQREPRIGGCRGNVICERSHIGHRPARAQMLDGLSDGRRDRCRVAVRPDDDGHWPVVVADRRGGDDFHVVQAREAPLGIVDGGDGLEDIRPLAQREEFLTGQQRHVRHGWAVDAKRREAVGVAVRQRLQEEARTTVNIAVTAPIPSASTVTGAAE